MANGWMSDLEALMWRLEHDPFLDPTFGSITFLEAPPDIEHLRARMAGVVAHHRRFGQRVVVPAGRLTTPAFVDTAVDLEHHVGLAPVGPRARRRDVFDLAASWLHEPLDHARPLWSFLVVEGLADGGAAVLQKVHHSVVDGEGGLQVWAELVDLSPQVPAVDAPPPTRPTSPPDPTGLLASAAGSALQKAGAAVAQAAGTTATLARHPSRLPRVAEDAGRAARSAVAQLTAGDQARSPLWTTRSLRRRLDGVDLSLPELRHAGRELGGSVNDAFVTVLTGAIGRLHREAGRPVEDLRMAMPVSTRRRGMRGGNAFFPTRVLVPVGEGDPRRRFSAVHTTLAEGKHDPLLSVVDPLATLANVVVPTAVATRVVHRQARAVDFAASNLRGADLPLWLAGARIVANYPIGPLTAAALNVTLLSLDGRCHLGLHGDAGAVPDLERLGDLVEEAHDELVAATR